MLLSSGTVFDTAHEHGSVYRPLVRQSQHWAHVFVYNTLIHDTERRVVRLWQLGLVLIIIIIIIIFIISEVQRRWFIVVYSATPNKNGQSRLSRRGSVDHVQHSLHVYSLSSFALVNRTQRELSLLLVCRLVSLLLVFEAVSL